jgi:GDPmannose 4,6-dehydratase
VQDTQPDEIYNLAARAMCMCRLKRRNTLQMVSVPCGFFRLFEFSGWKSEYHFYQASTSELYGTVQEIAQREITPIYPRSPYAAAKLYDYWITVTGERSRVLTTAD